MKGRLSIFVLSALAGTAAGTSVGVQHAASPAVIEALSGVDFLPESEALADVLAGDVATLVDLADNGTDAGVRIRAYRSLGMFDSDVARAGLKAAVDRYRAVRDGVELLYLIAAVEAYGQIGGTDAVTTLAPLLDSASRDLRSATAHALGATRAAAACQPLRARQSQETSSQVRIAIDEAIAFVCP